MLISIFKALRSPAIKETCLINPRNMLFWAWNSQNLLYLCCHMFTFFWITRTMLMITKFDLAGQIGCAHPLSMLYVSALQLPINWRERLSLRIYQSGYVSWLELLSVFMKNCNTDYRCIWRAPCVLQNTFTEILLLISHCNIVMSCKKLSCLIPGVQPNKVCSWGISIIKLKI